MGYRYADAREFFGAVLCAARDAERIHAQLLEMDEWAGHAPAPLPGGAVSGRTHDGLARSVAARLDREAMLARREDDDYRLIDAACAVLYGKDNANGLCMLVPPWWCDVLYHRYCAGMGWERVAEAMGCTANWAQQVANAALDAADAHGFAAAMDGRGFAEE